MYLGYVPGVVSLQVTRDGIPQLVMVPFRCVLVLLRCTYYFVFFHLLGVFRGLFCDHRLEIRKMS